VSVGGRVTALNLSTGNATVGEPNALAFVRNSKGLAFVSASP